MNDILLVTGTRPEIIKMAPIIKQLQHSQMSFNFVHTGQHFDYEMSKVFIDQLELPKPDASFILKGCSPASQIGEMMVKLGKVIESLDGKPHIMLVQGDTNSMLAAGLTAVKMSIKLGHVEAGLRSYDWRMPEEHNRRMIDHVSDLLFAPTEFAAKNLREEHVHGEIYVTGNTVIDAINIYFKKVHDVEDKVLSTIPFEEYGLVTFHRCENVDNPATLREFVMLMEKSPIPLVYPIHPRTKKRLHEFGLWSRLSSIPHLHITPPQGYFEFLALMKNARILLTDSGGLQEEATHPKIRKPVLLMRTSTERPEAVKAGFVKVVGVNHLLVLEELKKILETPPNLPKKSPFGDGKAAIRILRIIKSKLQD